ncbi:MAG TPA: glycosyltransferase [Acidobacteriaceae bacterium]|jgi:glycosyltransferase involved in cell wall biosynthesis|nr:glycosyltransferase [Acidobacteriaceae bacterium]
MAEQIGGISVLISVYSGESAAHFKECLESLARQTVPAGEVLIIKDGPLGENLEEVIALYSGGLPIRTVALQQNVGLGSALSAGVEECRFDKIARMDADDICALDRLELQAKFFEAHPEIDVVGGSIREFDADPLLGATERRLPSEHMAIEALAATRNPINHMTVAFRKRAVLAAGNYRPRQGFEDYDLWVRMLLNGSRFHNLPDVLVFARCGNGMQRRRGGWDYARREAALFWSFRSAGFLSTGQAARTIICRTPARLLPASLRTQLYNYFLRHRVSREGLLWRG